MFDFSIIGILAIVAIVLVILLWPLWLAIKFFINLAKKKNGQSGVEGFSPIDAGVQAFSVLGILFFWVFLGKFNQMLAEPLPGYSIILFLAVVCFAICYYFRIFSAAVAGIIMLLAGLNWHLFGGSNANLFAVAYDMGRPKLNFFPVLSIYIFFALTVYLLGRWHDQNEKEKKLAKFYLIFGIILSMVVLFVSTMRAMPLGGSLFELPMEFIVYFMIFLASVCFLAYINLQKQNVLPIEFAFIAIAFIFFLLFSLIGSGDQVRILLFFVANILLLGEAVGVLLLGYFKREDWYISFGTGLVILTVMIKYFDWFSFLDKSIYFIGAGALFFFLGMFLDKMRKMVLNNAKITQ